MKFPGLDETPALPDVEALNRIPRRRLTHEEVDGLIDEWNRVTRYGRSKSGLRKLGELFQWVGWTPVEMEAYLRHRRLPGETEG